MTTEIDGTVDAFLAERGPGEVNIASRPELGRLAGELNGLYWREAERILRRALLDDPDRVLLSPEERSLLDLGVLDWRLLPGADKNRPVFLKELYAPGRGTQFYFSEWMVQRFRHFMLYGGMSPAEGEPVSTTRLIRDMRGRLYMRLSPLFKNLPGFNQQAIDLFLTGRIDGTLDALTARLKKGPPDERSVEQHRQLSDIRNRMIARARDRALTSEDLGLFDALRKVDQESHEKRAAQQLTSDAAASRSVSPQEREKWVQDELKFVKQVLWLGLAGSGLARTYSVLLTAGARIVKSDVDAILALAKQCDPAMPDPSSILIAPYMGGGFYEWDRDTLFVPLVPTREPEVAVLQGVANHRILLDRFQDGGKFKKEYELALGGGDDFGGNFVRDYRAWVLGIGKGFKGALDPKRYAFFRDTMGPRAGNLFAPREWSGQTRPEVEEMVKAIKLRLARGEASFDDHYRMAFLALRDKQNVVAIHHLEEALGIQPVDGRALLSLAVLTLRTSGSESAKAKFAECMALAPGTIWSVYASDELQKL